MSAKSVAKPIWVDLSKYALEAGIKRCVNQKTLPAERARIEEDQQST